MTLQTPIFPGDSWRPLIKRRMPVEDQEARLIELAEIRAQRSLTASEFDELDELERKKYFRTIAKTRVEGQRLNAKDRGRAS